jgi:hypothetical protein
MLLFLLGGSKIDGFFVTPFIGQPSYLVCYQNKCLKSLRRTKSLSNKGLIQYLALPSISVIRQNITRKEEPENANFISLIFMLKISHT